VTPTGDSPTPWPPPVSPRTRGAAFEQLAAAWCSARGWQILARNVTCRRGEIDLIALDKATVVFIEVRQRTSSRYGTPAETVTAAKQRRLAAAIRYWLAGPVGRRYVDHPMRCDILAYTTSKQPPEWIANAFPVAPW